MADGAASAAPRRLLELLMRAFELSRISRFESAAAKALEAVAMARDTTPPQSLLRAYALVRHAEYTISHQFHRFLRSDTGRGTYAVDRVSYGSLREALAILFARADANTLLPGRMPADEEQSGLRLLMLEHQAGQNDSAAAVAAQLAEARAFRRGQCFGYRAFLQAAYVSFLTMYPKLSPPACTLPVLSTDEDNAPHAVDTLSKCIMQAVRWLGVSADGAPDAATNGVRWDFVGGLDGLLDGTKLCAMIARFAEAAQTEPQSRIQPDGFIRALNELWNSPQLAKRRQMWAVDAPHLKRIARERTQRAAADIARLGLATCANAGCDATESCPRAFKQCSKCSTAKYCSRECQLAAWPSHKRECKRMVAERKAGSAASAA
jgi:hypothetical protein